jgi:hypothetical protein
MRQQRVAPITEVHFPGDHRPGWFPDASSHPVVETLSVINEHPPSEWRPRTIVLFRNLSRSLEQANRAVCRGKVGGVDGVRSPVPEVHWLSAALTGERVRLRQLW